MLAGALTWPLAVRAQQTQMKHTRKLIGPFCFTARQQYLGSADTLVSIGFV